MRQKFGCNLRPFPFFVSKLLDFTSLDSWHNICNINNIDCKGGDRMLKLAVVTHERDNVATAVRDLKKGQAV